MSRCPALALLQGLTLRDVEYAEEGADLAALGFSDRPRVSSVLFHLARAPWLSGLRRLLIGDDDRSDDNDIGACRTRIDIRRCSSGRSDDVVRHRFGRRRETRNES